MLTSMSEKRIGRSVTALEDFLANYSGEKVFLMHLCPDVRNINHKYQSGRTNLCVFPFLLKGRVISERKLTMLHLVYVTVVN